MRVADATKNPNPYTFMTPSPNSAAGGSEAVSDEEVLAWANAAVSKAEAGGGHAAPCAGFRYAIGWVG